MAENVEIIKSTSLWGDAWKRLLKNKLAVFGLIVLTIIAVLVIFGPVILYWATGLTADGIPDDGDLIKSFPPSLTHLMGTDVHGRDMFARILQGGRISLMVGVISTLVSLIVGVSYGAVAGYLGGRIDNLMMRIVDMIYAIPYILIVIVLLSPSELPSRATNCPGSKAHGRNKEIRIPKLFRFHVTKCSCLHFFLSLHDAFQFSNELRCRI